MLCPLAIKPIENERRKITGKIKTNKGPLAKNAGSRTTFRTSRTNNAWNTETERTSFLITSSAFSEVIFFDLSYFLQIHDFIIRNIQP